MSRLMLGFAGEIAAGKGTATGLIQKWFPNSPGARFSDSLREFYSWYQGTNGLQGLAEDDARRLLMHALLTYFAPEVIVEKARPDALQFFQRGLRERWVPGSFVGHQLRSELQFLSTLVRQSFSEDILEHTVLDRMSRVSRESTVGIIEGIRRLVDISTLLSHDNFRLIYIEINQRVAYERNKERKENPDDADMTWEEFRRRGAAEAEEQIKLLKPYAHLIIDNSGAPRHLEEKLRSAVGLWLPSWQAP